MSCLIAALQQQALIQQAQFIMTFLLGEYYINQENTHTSRKSYNSIVKSVTFHCRCRHDGQTVVYLNGVSQEARFSFEAFHFMQPQNQTVSTFYLHCVTRLCENSTCLSMLPVTILLQCYISLAVFHRLGYI